MNTLNVGPPSMRERVGNVEEVNSITTEFEYITNKKKNMGEKKSYADIAIGDKTQGAIM